MMRQFLLMQLFMLSLPLLVLSQASKSDQNGGALYKQYCISCHQTDGGGVPHMVPPLFGTDYVTGDKKRLITILLKGLNEPIEVQDEEYYNPMASFSYLSNQQLAAILTYIRTNFGNKSSAITPQEVAKIRPLVIQKK
jgi:mono/diheme cytochrome c family protein